jgi:hypothetical protein
LGALAIYAVLLPDNLVNVGHFLKGSVGFKGMYYFFAALLAIDLSVILETYFFSNRFLIPAAKKLSVLEKYAEKAMPLILLVIFVLTIGNALTSDWLKLFKYPFDASPSEVFKNADALTIILMQFQPLIFSLTPIALLGLFIAWISKHEDDWQRWIIFVFSFFMLAYVAASYQQKILLSVRYSIILYPLVLTMAAMGIWQLLLTLKKYGLDKIKIAALTVVLALSAASLWLSKPFYFNYANFLLPQKYLVADAWGYVGYEAAAYLDARPDISQARVWADYNGVCVFINGNCSANKLTMLNILDKAEKSGKDPEFKYFVETRRGDMIANNLWDELKDTYDMDLIWTQTVGGRPDNFVKIYQVNLR